MASEGEFRAGHFYFPTSTGSFSVSDLAMEPQGIIFFGGNQDAEDTLLHPSTPGVWIGKAWRDVDSGAIDTHCQAIATFGTRWINQPICCLSGPGSIEYAASSVTFDAEGFTLNVSDAAPGSRLVHYLAWGEFDGAEGKSVGAGGQGVFHFLNLGYRPHSMLGISMFSEVRDGNNAGAMYHAMGVANFPESFEGATTNQLNHNVMSLTFHYPIQFGKGETAQWGDPLETAITYTMAGGVLGYWQDNWDHAYPYPTYESEGIRLETYGQPNRYQLTWIDCEASAHGVVVPNFGVESVTTARSYITDVQACLFFGTTGFDSISQTGVNHGFMFGVCTLDDQGNGYQGVVGFDSGAGDPPANGIKSFFQSKQACLVESMSPGGGIRVASGWIDGTQLHLLGEIASNGSIGHNWVQMWGKDVGHPDMWIMEV